MKHRITSGNFTTMHAYQLVVATRICDIYLLHPSQKLAAAITEIGIINFCMNHIRMIVTVHSLAQGSTI
jgi:hypothetical protein